MATKAKEVDSASVSDEKIVQFRGEGRKWGEISDAVGMPPGKCMFRYAVATTAPKDRVKNATGADVVRLRDEAVLSWGVIAARTGLPESRVKSLYEETSGRTTLGNRIGKGGRFPGGSVDGEKPQRTTKKAAAKEAAAPSALVIELTELGDDLEKVQALLTHRSLKLGDGEVVKVRSVKAVKNGAVSVVNDETGKARAVKVANITNISKGKTVKASA